MENIRETLNEIETLVNQFNEEQRKERDLNNKTLLLLYYDKLPTMKDKEFLMRIVDDFVNVKPMF